MSRRPPSIVISDWLANYAAGSMTPFEASQALMNYLQDEGYYVMRPADAIEAARAIPDLNHPGSGKQKQSEDWPYPEGNPTCAQDLK